MDVNLLKSFAKLRLTLLQMEKEIGLGEISPAESAVICAAALIVDNRGRVELASLMVQEPLAAMSRSTFFRAIKSLGARQLLVKESESKVSDYILKS